MKKIGLYYCYIMIGVNSVYLIWSIIDRSLTRIAVGLSCLIVSIVCVKILWECKKILK